MNTSPIQVLVIEDEVRAANRLIRMLKSLDPTLVFSTIIPSVEKACEYLSTEPMPDLIFLDIQLEDGDCFEIFNKVTVTSPIIFCTAYNEYALQAFKVNSIDYLLKPINQQALSKALEKYQQLFQLRMPENWSQVLYQQYNEHKTKALYRRRFLATSQKKLIPVLVEDIDIIVAFMKGCKLISRQSTHQSSDLTAQASTLQPSQQEWLLDDSLSEIESTLDPSEFLRISRQSIVRILAIQAFDLAELTVTIIQPSSTSTLSVSRSRIKAIKMALCR